MRSSMAGEEAIWRNVICTGICIESYLLQQETRSGRLHSDALIQREDPRRDSIEFALPRAYISGVGQPTMAIHGL